MKIFVEGSKRAAVGRLFPVWEKLGHHVVKNPEKANVQLSVITIRRKREIPVVLRLDGIYYDKDRKYKRFNSVISKAHQRADAIVYQSECSKKMCDKYLTKRTTNFFQVIHNGIDPAGWNSPKKHKGINIVACAKWRRPKRLEEMVQIFDIFLKYYPGSTLHIIGRFKLGGKKFPRPKIVYHGQVDFKKMIDIYRTADICLHLCKRDSCPSSVVEAIAAGIPVVTTNAGGGATEMCRLTEGCIVVDGESESLEPVYAYKNEFNKMSRQFAKRIAKNMVKIVENKVRVSLPKELTVDYVAKQYLNLMEKVIQK